MLMMSVLLRQLLLLPVGLFLLLPFQVVHGKYVLSIEPYIGEWCSVQFPQATGLLEATNGLGMASMVRDGSYQLLEPFAAQYCFDVFGHDQLKNVDQDATKQQLSQRGKHGIQIEPYLMEWGQKAILSPNGGGSGGGGGLAVPDVEQYIVDWCVKGQFRKEIRAAKGGLQQALEDSGRYRTKAQQIELDLAPWCWEQFPTEMKDLDQQQAMSRLSDNNHGTNNIVQIEPYLMKWEIANFHVRNHPDIRKESSQSSSTAAASSSSGGGSSWGGFFFKFVLLIGGCVVGIGYLQKNHPHVTEAAQERIQQFLQQQRTGGFGFDNNGSNAPMMMMPPYDHTQQQQQQDYDPFNNNDDETYRGIL